MNDTARGEATPHETQARAALEELPLHQVEADASWNCRRQYTEAEVLEAVERYRHEPMLHPPSVVLVDEDRFRLVTGFLRFEVMKRLGHDTGWFRLIAGTEEELLLWNLGENTARRDLTGYELVERVWLLHCKGVDKARITRACGFSVRYLNRLLYVRRRAHPELYEKFRTSPQLTIARMARLCTHPADTQMVEYQQSEALLRRAGAVEQGYSDDLAGSDAPTEDGRRLPKQRRRRLPPRAQVRRLLTRYEKSSHLDPNYRQGVVASLRHLLYGDPLPEQTTAVG